MCLEKAAAPRNQVHFLSADGCRLTRVESVRSGVTGVPVSACLSIVRCWIAAEIIILAIVILLRGAT